MGGDECNQIVESQEEVAAQIFRVKHKLEALLHLQQEPVMFIESTPRSKRFVSPSMVSVLRCVPSVDSRQDLAGSNIVRAI